MFMRLYTHMHVASGTLILTMVEHRRLTNKVVATSIAMHFEFTSYDYD